MPQLFHRQYLGVALYYRVLHEASCRETAVKCLIKAAGPTSRPVGLRLYKFKTNN